MRACRLFSPLTVCPPRLYPLVPLSIRYVADTPSGDSGKHACLRIFGRALVGGLAAAVVLSPRGSEIRG